MKVLVVRAAEDARRTATRLAAAGHEAIVAPVLTIRALDFPEIGGAFDAVVASSAHAFAAPTRLANLRDRPLFVVGARTGEAAAQAGFAAPRAIASTAADLAPAVSRLPRGARVLYLAGRDRKPDLETALGGHCMLTILETYAAESEHCLPSAAVDAIASCEAAVLHYSHRSAAIFLELAEKAGLLRRLPALRHIAISADAAKPLISADLEVAVAAQPNEDSMMEELARMQDARAGHAGKRH